MEYECLFGSPDGALLLVFGCCLSKVVGAMLCFLIAFVVAGVCFRCMLAVEVLGLYKLGCSLASDRIPKVAGIDFVLASRQVGMWGNIVVLPPKD